MTQQKMQFGLAIRGQYASNQNIQTCFEELIAECKAAEALGFDSITKTSHYSTAPWPILGIATHSHWRRGCSGVCVGRPEHVPNAKMRCPPAARVYPGHAYPLGWPGKPSKAFVRIERSQL